MNPAERELGSRGCAISLVIIPVMLFACGFSIFAMVTLHCVDESGRWIIDYPDSEVVSQEHDWLVEWGIGTTSRVLYTPDPPGVVRAWYSGAIVEKIEQTGDTRGSGVAQIPFPFITEADDGEGTMIFLTCRCAPTLKMW